MFVQFVYICSNLTYFAQMILPVRLRSIMLSKRGKIPDNKPHFLFVYCFYDCPSSMMNMVASERRWHWELWDHVERGVSGLESHYCYMMLDDVTSPPGLLSQLSINRNASMVTWSQCVTWSEEWGRLAPSLHALSSLRILTPRGDNTETDLRNLETGRISQSAWVQNRVNNNKHARLLFTFSLNIFSLHSSYYI